MERCPGAPFSTDLRFASDMVRGDTRYDGERSAHYLVAVIASLMCVRSLFSSLRHGAAMCF